MSTASMGLFEAKTHLSELVARAEQGEEVIITRHNRPVAKIGPVGEMTAVDVERRWAAIARLQAVGAEMTARGGPITPTEILDWIEDGRE